MSLILLLDEDAQPGVQKSVDVELAGGIVLILVALLIILPMFFKVALVVLLAVIGIIYIRPFERKQSIEPEPAFIFFSTENIRTQIAGEERSQYAYMVGLLLPI